MKKIIKRVTIILILITVMTQMSIVVFAAPNIPVATTDFYVNDFANVFSEEEKEALIERSVNLANTTDGIQVVITTVESLDGNALEDYANKMYNQYEIGKNDMGVLILLSTGDREIRVEVGRKMEAYINDSKAGRFIDKYAIPKLKENKFNEGLISLQTELINEINNCIEKDNTLAESRIAREPIIINWEVVVTVILIISVLGIFVVIVFNNYKKSKKIEELEEIVSEINSKLKRTENDASNRIEAAHKETREILKQKQVIDSQYNTLKDRYHRGTVLFADLDKKVDIMIEEEIRQHDMDKAALANLAIEQVLSLSASKEALPKFEQAICVYNALTKKQQEYVKADVKKVRSLHEKSTQLNYKHLAGVAMVTITAIITAITMGKEKHIRDLEKAKSIYDELDSGSKKYIDKNILEKICELLAQAKYDKKKREDDEEEERRKRRQQEQLRRSSNSSSSFNYRSNSGFGGRSGGGGASRKF